MEIKVIPKTYDKDISLRECKKTPEVFSGRLPALEISSGKGIFACFLTGEASFYPGNETLYSFNSLYNIAGGGSELSFPILTAYN